MIELVSLYSKNVLLFSDTEGAEDQVQDVIGRSGAGDFIQRPECMVEVQQEHLMRDPIADRSSGRDERGERLPDQILMA